MFAIQQIIDNLNNKINEPYKLAFLKYVRHDSIYFDILKKLYREFPGMIINSRLQTNSLDSLDVMDVFLCNITINHKLEYFDYLLENVDHNYLDIFVFDF